MNKSTAFLALSLLAFSMAIQAQNVGIGTNEPFYKLDVEGNIRAKANFVYMGIQGQYIASSGATVLYTNASLEPHTTNILNIGSSNFRWRNIFTTNLNTSQSILSEGQSGLTGIFLGNNVPGKEPNAGRIGYGIFTSKTLDIVGGGDFVNTRRIKLWAEDVVEASGNLWVYGNTRVDGALTVQGKIQRNSTGATNLVPIAMASVNEFGTVVGGTGNISVVKNMSSGLSEITITGETITINGYIIQVTPVYTNPTDDIEDYAVSVRIADGKIRLYILRNSTASNSAYHLIAYKLG